jgi:nicotinamide-nucleotide amidase
VTLASEAIDGLREAGASVATAESLTGGLVCATLVSVAGASDVVLGGIVAYSPQAKIDLLGVDSALIAEHGTVDAEVAVQLAMGARRRFDATYALSTTGVAGPDASEGKAVGTVHVAIAGPSGVSTTELHLEGDRDMIRTGTVDALLSQLVATLGEESRSSRG